MLFPRCQTAVLRLLFRSGMDFKGGELSRLEVGESVGRQKRAINFMFRGLDSYRQVTGKG